MKEYAYSSDGSRWYRSIEELEGKEALYRGEVKDCNHEDFVDVDDIIEMIQKRAYDEIGGYGADDYLSDITSLDREDFRKTIVAWLDTHAQKSDYWTVENIIKVGKEDARKTRQ